MNMDLNKHLKIVVIIFYVITGLLAAYFLFARLISFLMPFVLALIFAFFLNPLADAVTKRLKIPRNLASISVIILVGGALASVLVIVGSELYSLLEELISGFMSEKNFGGLIFISDKINEIFGAEINLAESFKNLINPLVSGVINIVKPIATGAPKMFISAVMFILATHFLIADKEKIMAFFNKITDNRFSRITDGFKTVSKKSVLKYVKAQLTIMLITLTELIIGFFILEWLGILKLEYTFVIVFLIAVLDALPVFGTGAVLIPWAVYGVIVGEFPLAVGMLVIYLVCLTVRQLIEPKIVGESLGIHPLITLLSMYVGLKTVGVGGFILFPLLAVLIIQLVKMGVFGSIFKEQ